MLIGAGVIPFEICMHTGKILFYFAREKFARNWKGSLKWSGFEGGARNGEYASETAEREFYEEATGCHNIHTIKRDLTHKNYALEIITSHPNSNRYVTYVRECTNFEATLVRFSQIRSLIETLQRTSLKESRVQQMSGIRGGDVAVTQDEDTQLRNRNFQLRQHALATRIRQMCPECINMCLDADGLLQSYTISECYIEKDIIQAWTLADIGDVLRFGMVEKIFRHTFIPILYVLRREFIDDIAENLQNHQLRNHVDTSIPNAIGIHKEESPKSPNSPNSA